MCRNMVATPQTTAKQRVRCRVAPPLLTRCSIQSVLPGCCNGVATSWRCPGRVKFWDIFIEVLRRHGLTLPQAFSDFAPIAPYDQPVPLLNHFNKLESLGLHKTNTEDAIYTMRLATSLKDLVISCKQVGVSDNPLSDATAEAWSNLPLLNAIAEDESILPLLRAIEVEVPVTDEQSDFLQRKKGKSYLEAFDLEAGGVHKVSSSETFLEGLRCGVYT